MASSSSETTGLSPDSSGVNQTSESEAVDDAVAAAAASSQARIRGVEQVEADDPPRPFEYEDDFNFEDLKEKKSSNERIVGSGIGFVNGNDAHPLPAEQIADFGDEKEKKLSQSKPSSVIGSVEQIDDNDAPLAIGQTAPFNEDWTETKKDRTSTVPLAAPSPTPPPAPTPPSNPIPNPQRANPNSSPLEPPTSTETAHDTLILEATLVTPEPPAPVYDAVMVPHGDAEGNPPSQPEPFWKRRSVVGGGLLLILSLVAVIAALVSTQLSGGEGETANNSSEGAALNGSSNSSVQPPLSPITYTPSISPRPSTSPSPTFNSSFELYAWGFTNYFGLFPELDTPGHSLWPKPMSENVVDASAGEHHSLILLPDGTARSVGHIRSLRDYYGELGVMGVTEGNNPFRDISHVVDTESGETINSPPFKRVFSGLLHSVLIDIDGTAWTTGFNWDGQLCLGDVENRMIPHKVPMEGQIVDVAVGAYHTLLLHENGTAFGCGRNAENQLGLGYPNVEYASSPTKIEGLGSVASVSVGFSSSLFVSSNGLHATGLDTPHLLLDINPDEVVSFKSGGSSSYILFKNGTVLAFGDNYYGQLGDSTNETKVRTTTLTPAPIKKIIGVGPIAQSVFFIDHDGVVYATGANWNGMLGVGDEEHRNVPTVVDFGGDVDVEHILVGWEYALALVKEKAN